MSTPLRMEYFFKCPQMRELQKFKYVKLLISSNFDAANVFSVSQNVVRTCDPTPLHTCENCKHYV